MKRENARELMLAAIGLIGIALPMLSSWISGIAGVLSFVLGLGFLAVAVWYFFRSNKPEVEDRPMGDDYSIKTGDIFGGSNKIGHEIQINHKAPQRHLVPDVAADLARKLPKNRPVSVLGMNGNTESLNFANEIHALLKQQGYAMKEDRAVWHMFFDPPVRDFNISGFENETEWMIVVGPAE